MSRKRYCWQKAWDILIPFSQSQNTALPGSQDTKLLHLIFVINMIREIQITNWTAITTSLTEKCGPDREIIIGSSLKFTMIFQGIVIYSEAIFMHVTNMQECQDMLNELFNIKS